MGSGRLFSKVISELSILLTSWILVNGDPFLKVQFQFGAEPWLRAGEGKSLKRRSKGRLGVPPGGAEQGEHCPWRGIVPGKFKHDSRRRLFLGVFPTADKSRRARPGTDNFFYNPTKIKTDGGKRHLSFPHFVLLFCFLVSWPALAAVAPTIAPASPAIIPPTTAPASPAMMPPTTAPLMTSFLAFFAASF